MSNLESMNHLSHQHNQISNNTRKECISDSRSRALGGHRKALESYDSKLGHFNYTRKGPTTTTYQNAQKIGTNMLYKNATQGHEDGKLKGRSNVAGGYINMKSFREKNKRQASVKPGSENNHDNGIEKNKENTDTGNRAMVAIKSSINIIDDQL